MVHRKSEYRLQFHFLGKDLRKKIWEDNITFRESCRKLNQADHYWTYQLTDERCECEDDDEAEDEAALPQHKLKHKILVAKYGKEEPQAELTDPAKPVELISSPVHVVSQPENQTLEAQDTAIQDAQRQRKNEVSDLEERYVQEKISPSIRPPKEHVQMKELTYPDVSKQQNIKVHEARIQQLKEDFSNDRHRSSATGHISDRSILPASSRTSHVTRTSKKAYFEGRKSPFAPFGWNDSDRDIGEKKTYNVCAPEKEVYSPALLALKRRREAIEKYLSEEAEKRRQELSSSSVGPVNHSSIWMSEYQEKFSHGKKFVPEKFYSRPKSAFPCHRSCGWRYS